MPDRVTNSAADHAARLAARLREAREAAGLTQAEAAEHLGLPRTAVVQIESAKRSVNSLELAAFARLYHREVGELLSDAPLEADPVEALFRADAALREDPATRGRVANAASLCELGVKIEEGLGRPPRLGPPVIAVRPPRNRAHAMQQGEQVAGRVRESLGLGTAPIADVADLLDREGIWTSGIELPDEWSGLCLSGPSLGVAVLVNVTHARTRKRFSYAHEYAHALLDRGPEASALVSSKANASELMECRANAFAAALLMPAAGVRSLLDALDKGGPSRTEAIAFDVAGDSFVEAKDRAAPNSQTITFQDAAVVGRHFGASYAAAVFRLKNLGLINYDRMNELLAQAEDARDYLALLAGVRDEAEDASEGDRGDRELISQVLWLVVEGYRRGTISRGGVLDAAGRLGLDKRTVLRLAEVAGA